MSSSETSKIRARILPYIKSIISNGGIGIDIGCGNDRIVKEADGVDSVQPLSYKGSFWKWEDLSNLNNLRDKCYDYVYSSYDLSFKDDKKTFLKEWLRILKDKGTFFLYQPYKYIYPSGIISVLKELIPELWIVTQEVRGNRFLIIVRKKPPVKPRFLIKANKNIGDCLTSVQVAKDLKDHWTENGCEITCDSNTIGMYDNNDYIDHIKNIDDKDIGNAFDGVISMITNEHEYGNYHRRTSHFRNFPTMIAVENGYYKNPKDEFYKNPKDIGSIPYDWYNWNKVSLTEVVSGENWIKGYVVVSPDVFIVRSWEKHKWNSLFLSIKTSGKYIVLVGQNKNKRYVDADGIIDLRGKTPTIGHIEAVLKGADYVVCPDTGIAHISSILGKKTVVIGGPADLDLTFYKDTIKVKSKSKFYGIQNKKLVDVVNDEWDIKYSEGEQPPMFSNENPPNTICPSMTAISVEQVIEKIKEIDEDFEEDFNLAGYDLKKDPMNIVPDSKPTLSVCITERNEQDVIMRCMDSVIGLADEIVIHDTGSTDKTIEVVKEWSSVNSLHMEIPKVKIVKSGNEFYDEEGNFHFGNAKTKAFKEATSDYVMWMDASDYMENKETTLGLRKTFDNAVAKNKNIYIECLTGLGGVFRRERIVPRENAEFVYPCHEVVKLQGGLTKIKTDYIIKHSHATNQWEESANRNLKILEKEWKIASNYETNNYPKFDASRICFYLANTYRELSKYDEAIRLYKLRVDRFWSVHPEEVFKSYEYITEITINQVKKGTNNKTWEDVIKAANCCIYYWNGRREGHYYVGDAYLNLGDFEKAINKYEKCLSLPIPDVQLWINQNVHSDDVIRKNIAYCKKQLGIEPLKIESDSHCPICLNKKAVKPRQDLEPHPYIECTKCKTYYQPIKNEKIYEAYNEISGDQMSDVDKTVNQDLADRLYKDHLVKKIKSDKYFHLDIGTKYPYLSHCIQKHGVKSYGIDGIQKVIEFGKELGVETFKRDIEKDGIEWENKIHLVTLIHCIEHFYNPLKILKIIRKAMITKGILFIRTPDHQTDGVEAHFSKGHYQVHPTVWCESSMRKTIELLDGMFFIEETYPMHGQRDYILRAL